jgi:hypothetical protein
MSCGDFERLVTAFVDGELDPERASALRGHARGCARCAAAIAHEASVRDGLAALEVAEPPAALWAGIDARLAEAEVADASRPRIWLWWQAVRPRAYAGALAAATAALALVYALSAHGEHSLGASQGADADAAARAAAIAAATPAFHEQRAAEWRAADARYRAAIAELRAILDEDRAAWEPEQLAELEARLRALDERLDQLGDEPPREHDGDALFAAYREELALLQDAALLGALP